MSSIFGFFIFYFWFPSLFVYLIFFKGFSISGIVDQAFPTTAFSKVWIQVLFQEM